MKNIKKYAALYENELFNNVIPFWEKYSIDTENGGYFTCLDCEGKVYDTDKFVWPQARQVWIFSMLYNRYKQKSRWLDIAGCGVKFLTRYGIDEAGMNAGNGLKESMNMCGRIFRIPNMENGSAI